MRDITGQFHVTNTSPHWRLMTAKRPVLAWWQRPVTWFSVAAVAIVVGVGLAFYTEFWMLLAAAPLCIALGVAAWIAIVVRVHGRADSGAGTEAEFDALLRDYLPFKAPTTIESLQDRWRAASAAGRVDNS